MEITKVKKKDCTRFLEATFNSTNIRGFIKNIINENHESEKERLHRDF